MNKNLIMGVIAVAALGAAIWLMLGQGPANNEDPAETLDQTQYWACNACKADLIMTKAQYMEAVRAGTFKCAACGSDDLLLAVGCPVCSRSVPTIGHGRLPQTCPHCNADLGDHRDVGTTPGAGRESGPRPRPPG